MVQQNGLKQFSRLKYACALKVLLHLRSFCKNFVCAYHTLARIKVVHLRSVLVLHLRLYIHRFSLASC